MSEPASCSNCQSPLRHEARFCSHCGQTTQYAPRSLRAIVQGVLGRDFAPDGRLWLTLRTLLVPGALTLDWIEGRQQRHIGPMRLFLFVVFVLTLALQLMLAATRQAHRVDATTELEPRFLVVAGPAWGDPQPLLVQRYAAEATVIVRGGWLREALLPWAIEAKATLERMDARGYLEHAAPRINATMTQAQILVLPVLIGLLGLAHVAQGQRIAKHTVFALHALAFWLLLDLAAMLGARAVGGPPATAVRDILAWLIPAIGSAWLLLAMHRVYPVRPGRALVRGVLVVGGLLLAWPYVETLAVLLALA